MTAVVKNLTADRGGTFKLSVRYRAPDGQPIDLTGWTAEFLVLDRVDGALIDTRAGTTSADGWAVVKVADEDTLTWPISKTSYRFDLEDPGGDKYWLLMGTLHVRSGHDA